MSQSHITLSEYRLEQALTTLAEAEQMLREGFSTRSIVNRSYYAMFYMVLSLLLKRGIQITTGKHSGVMAIFDKEFILAGLLDRKHSKALHKAFDRRLEFDYKEFVVPSGDDARGAVASAQEFLAALQEL